MSVLEFLWVYLKSSFFVIGGGQTFVPLLYDEFVKTGIMSLTDFNEFVALAQLIPGPVMLHMTVLTSYKVKGIHGVLIALPCTFMAPIAFISSFMYFRHKFKDSPKFDTFIFYSKALVIGILLNIAYNMGKTNVIKDFKAIGITIASFLLLTFFNVNSIYVILGTLGIIWLL